MTNDLMLVIDHRDTQVRMDGRALRIARPQAAPEHVPLGLLGLVVVHGSPMVGCEVWRELAERNIPTVLQPARGRGRAALIGAAQGGTIALRIAQHRAAADPEAALEIARRLVIAKITAQRELCTRLDPERESTRALIALQDQAIDRCGMARTQGTLLGLEGSAAAGWYDWLAGWLVERDKTGWRFQGRNRRPPRDPVNALLSLGYTLLAGEVLRASQEQGLDPALGFLHGVVPGREALVLDLMEPLRPSVDLLTIGLIDGVLLPTHFTYSARDGCRLNKNARGRFYREWAAARNDWPDLHHPLQSAPPAADDEAAADSAPPQTTLPALCRRQVQRLRDWLGPKMTAVSTPDTDADLDGGDDNG